MIADVSHSTEKTCHSFVPLSFIKFHEIVKFTVHRDAINHNLHEMKEKLNTTTCERVESNFASSPIFEPSIYQLHSFRLRNYHTDHDETYFHRFYSFTIVLKKSTFTKDELSINASTGLSSSHRQGNIFNSFLKLGNYPPLHHDETYFTRNGGI